MKSNIHICILIASILCGTTVAGFLTGMTRASSHVTAAEGEPSKTPKKQAKKPAAVPTPTPTPSLVATTSTVASLPVGLPATDLTPMLVLSDHTAATAVTCGLTVDQYDKADFLGFVGPDGTKIYGRKETTDPITVICQNKNGTIPITINKISPEVFATAPSAPVVSQLTVPNDQIVVTLPNDKRQTLKSLLKYDDDIDSATPFIELAHDETFRLNIPACGPATENDNANHTKRKTTSTCYELLSSDPAVVAVAGGRSLMGAGTRGESVISVRAVKKTEILDLSTGVTESLSLEPDHTTTYSMPVGKNAAGNIEGIGHFNVRIVRTGPALIRSGFTVMSEDDAKKTFGHLIGNNYYCITATIVNSSGTDLQLTSIAFENKHDSTSVDPIPFSVVRTEQDHHKVWTARNISLAAISAVGEFMTGFNPFFVNISHQNHYKSFINILTVPGRSGVDAVWPNTQDADLLGLDNLGMRSDKLLPASGSTAPNSVLFIPKGAISNLAPANKKNPAEVKKALGELKVNGFQILRQTAAPIGLNP